MESKQDKNEGRLYRVGEPVTVKECLMTLPEPIRSKAIQECKYLDATCWGIFEALYYFMPRSHFWRGCACFVVYPNSGPSEKRQRHGYYSMKAAYASLDGSLPMWVWKLIRANRLMRNELHDLRQKELQQLKIQ